MLPSRLWRTVRFIEEIDFDYCAVDATAASLPPQPKRALSSVCYLRFCDFAV
jgi:hypothetical protein